MFYLKSYFEKHKFIKNIATLMSGTVFAQLITFLSMLLITNFYTASEFGVYAIFISISSIFTVIATGRYELAIILPKHHGIALNILVLISFISLLFCSALFIFLFFSYSFIIKYINIQLGYNVLKLLPVFIFFSSLSQAFYYFFNRFAEYKIMSLSRLMYSLINALTMYFFGKYCIINNGLLVSCVITNIVIVVFYLVVFFKKYGNYFLNIRLSIIKKIAFRYKDFPKYGLFGASIGNFAIQVPIFLLSTFYSNSIVGFYSLCHRSITAPLQIITSAFGDVFRHEASIAFNKNGNCETIFTNFAKKLICFGFILFIPLLILGKEIYCYVFGQGWETAGLYAQILAPMFIFRIVASPLSTVSVIAEKQSLDLILQIVIIIVVVVFTLVSKYLFGDNYSIIIAFSIAYSIIYLISLFLNYSWSKGKK